MDWQKSSALKSFSSLEPRELELLELCTQLVDFGLYGAKLLEVGRISLVQPTIGVLQLRFARMHLALS